jgi:mannitol-1-phosphate 5-dehydrogenase
MTAVHFGAGNIGRGFIGLLLHQAGHEVVFADVDAALVARIDAADSYRVIEAGADGVTEVTGFRAIDSRSDPAALTAAIASADIVTTAVGPNVLPFIAPAIAEGLRARTASAPLVVMACENAVNATDRLRAAIEEAGVPPGSAVYANTAVDRIVPIQHQEGLDVLVEPYFEWTIESGPFDGAPPAIPGAHFVPDLAPYIERKLFTVNTGHAATAYAGWRAGIPTIAASLAVDAIRDRVENVLAETSLYLADAHGLAADDLAAYRATTIGRFLNPALDDEVVRVGRQPLRKLSRGERFVAPAAALAAAGGRPVALLESIGDALRFDAPEDGEALRLQELLAGDDDIPVEVMGLTPDDALYTDAEAEVRMVRGALAE